MCDRFVSCLTIDTRATHNMQFKKRVTCVSISSGDAVTTMPRVMAVGILLTANSDKPRSRVTTSSPLRNRYTSRAQQVVNKT